MTSKIYGYIAAWLVLAGALFGHFFPAFDLSNQRLVSGFNENRKNLDKLKAEQQSYRLAKQDLENVQKEQIPPENFFSKDITLVTELRTIEDLSSRYHVNVELTGLSGTLQNAPHAQTQSQIFLVPYSLTIQGSFGDALRFLDAFEHVPFATSASSISVGLGEKDTVNLTLVANFYVSKQ